MTDRSSPTPPPLIVTDLGRNEMADAQQVAAATGATVVVTPPYRPQAKGREERRRNQYGQPLDAPLLGTPQPRHATSRAIDAEALDALLQAGSALAQTVRDVVDDTRDSAPLDPMAETAAAALEAEWEAWEAAYARTEGGER
jgi:hypothetical protein